MYGHDDRREDESENAGLTRSVGVVVDERFRQTRPVYCTGCTSERVMMLPMTFVLAAIILLTYYPFVILEPHETTYQKFEMVIFHVSLLFMLASYFQCMCLDPGTVPPLWVAEHEEDESLQRCRKSNLPKPPRAHYCSITKRLVLNMDHFCPWIVNTVGFYNRKFFVLFLLWTCVTICIFIGSSIVRLSTNRTMDVVGAFNLYLALLIDAALLLFLTGFLVFHLFLVFKNRTTIEMNSTKFDVGMRANFEQVFGQNPWIWFLPVYGRGPNGDGLHWPMEGGEVMAISVERNDMLSDPVGASQVEPHIIEMETVETNTLLESNSDGDVAQQEQPGVTDRV